jgi:hypothetical protein
MTYHHADRAKYVKSGKKLASKTIESLTNYFQALFSQKKKSMARSNVPRSIVCAIAQKNDSQATSARSARCAGRATRDASSGIMRDVTIIDCIVNNTMMMVTTIATIPIVTAVDADSDKRNANATIKKKRLHGDRRAPEAPQGQRLLSDNAEENVGAT